MTNRSAQHLSDATRLANAPELAMVTTVDDALETLVLALAAANPDLGLVRRDWHAPVDLGVRLAEGVIRDARRLQARLRGYRALAVVARAERRPPPIRGACGCCHCPGLIVDLPHLAPEQAALLVDGVGAFAEAVRRRYENDLADLAARRAETASRDDEADEADEDEAPDDLPF